jgi:lysophospholipase L1-like esterase
MSRTYSRRDFVATAAGAAATLGCAPHLPPAIAPTATPPIHSTVLFQGDSITDAGRDKSVSAPNSGSALGTGYPLLLGADLLDAYPERDLEVYNRGVSGNKVPDLTARWAADTLALKPTMLSILIGVNDYWHTRTHGYTGTSADYERQYSELLASTRTVLQALRLVILEPFVLRTGVVDDSWLAPLEERRRVAARVAANAGATFVPLQTAFDRAAERGGPAYWIGDGVHPTPAGHALIAERWRAAVGW